MTKAELVTMVAEKADLTKKDAEKAISALVESISETLAKGEKIQLVGFGTFEVRERAAREGVNPRTGDKIKIAASKVPAFKAGSALKDARRTVANEACDAEKVSVNGKPARASYDVKVGDEIEINMGKSPLKIRVLKVVEVVGKDGASDLYEVV